MSQVQQKIRVGFAVLSLAALAACQPDYSPDTYSAAAMQQANKVDPGVVVGFREVKISADGTVGAVTGGAAGGILGAGVSSPEFPTALTALGGSVVGGLVGNAVEHTTGDTTGWEYIVRETKGDLISVTQREPKPIPIGQQVLVIEGKQARIVPDYAAAAADPPAPATQPKQKPAARDVPAPLPAAAATTVAPVPDNVPAPAATATSAMPAPSSTGSAATAPATSTGATPANPPIATPTSAPGTATPTTAPSSSASESGSSEASTPPSSGGASPNSTGNSDSAAAKPQS